MFHLLYKLTKDVGVIKKKIPQQKLYSTKFFFDERMVGEQKHCNHVYFFVIVAISKCYDALLKRKKKHTCIGNVVVFFGLVVVDN